MAVGSPFEMSPLFSRDCSGPLLPMWPFREEIFTRLFSHWPNLLKNTFHPIYTYMFPRVFGDEFGDELGDSLNLVINVVTNSVMNFVNH